MQSLVCQEAPLARIHGALYGVAPRDSASNSKALALKRIAVCGIDTHDPPHHAKRLQQPSPSSSRTVIDPWLIDPVKSPVKETRIYGVDSKLDWGRVFRRTGAVCL